ncbi:outer membrane protein assembly factor BamB family protein [Natrinema limicola]|nr:PQQ-binding-like beta-propeller repeat protein [Natrinema limicola]
MIAAARTPLSKRLQAMDGRQRRALERALTTAVAETDGRPVTATLCDELDADGVDRQSLAGEIARLAAAAPDDAAAARDRLVALLEAEDEAVRGYAALALGILTVTGRDDGAALGDAIDETDGRLHAAASLVSGETPTHTDEINTQLSGMGRRLDDEPWAAGLAVLALSVLANESAKLRPTGISKIAAGLGVESPIVRVTAGRTLASMAADDPDSFDAVTDELCAALSDADADVRATASATLADIAELTEALEGDEDRLTTDLRPRLADPDGRVRTRVLRILTAVDAVDALPAVRPLTDDPVPGVAGAATTATERLEYVSGHEVDDGREWPMAGAGPAGTNAVAAGDELGTRPTVQWHLETAGDIEAPPALVGDIVFLADGNGVAALALADGSERWRVESDTAIETTPAVVDDTVYIAGDAVISALEADTGERVWRHAMDEPVRTPPTVSDGTVYVGGETLSAIDVETGQSVWTKSVDDRIVGLAVADGVVYVACDKRVVAFAAANGDQRWETDIALEGTIRSAPAVADGRVYLSCGDTLCVLAAADGERQFRFDTGGRLPASPAVADGTVYVASADGSLYAIDASTGSERWREALGQAVTGPVVLGDTVCLMTTDGRLHALSTADGSQRWESTPDAVGTEPAIAAASGRLCLGSDAGLTAFGADQSSWTASITGLLTGFGDGPGEQ